MQLETISSSPISSYMGEDSILIGDIPWYEIKFSSFSSQKKPCCVLGLPLKLPRALKMWITALLRTTFMAVEWNQRESKWPREGHTGNLWQSQEFPESQSTVFNYWFFSPSSSVFRVEVKPVLCIHFCIYTQLENLCRPFSKEHLQEE